MIGKEEQQKEEYRKDGREYSKITERKAKKNEGNMKSTRSPLYKALGRKEKKLDLTIEGKKERKPTIKQASIQGSYRAS